MNDWVQDTPKYIVNLMPESPETQKFCMWQQCTSYGVAIASELHCVVLSSSEPLSKKKITRMLEMRAHTARPTPLHTPKYSLIKLLSYTSIRFHRALPAAVSLLSIPLYFLLFSCSATGHVWSQETHVSIKSCVSLKAAEESYVRFIL